MSTTGETSGDHAQGLVEAIDDGSVDPEDIDLDPFVEDDLTAMTPALWERLPEAKRQEYNERVMERDEDELRETRLEKEEQHEEAIQALRDAEDDDLATVELGEVELEVKTYLSAPIKRELQRLDDNRDDPAVQGSVLPRVMAWLVEAPDEYMEESLWVEYGEEYGYDELALVWFEAMMPKVERQENHEAIQKFREFQEGSVDS